MARGIYLVRFPERGSPPQIPRDICILAHPSGWVFYDLCLNCIQLGNGARLIYRQHCSSTLPTPQGGSQMDNIPLDPAARQISEEESEMASTLRRVASDIEHGEVRQLILTVIRQDGAIERLGNLRSKLH